MIKNVQPPTSNSQEFPGKATSDCSFEREVFEHGTVNMPIRCRHTSSATPIVFIVKVHVSEILWKNEWDIKYYKQNNYVCRLSSFKPVVIKLAYYRMVKGSSFISLVDFNEQQDELKITTNPNRKCFKKKANLFFVK